MRALRWLFILFQVAWLNVVMPGHTRGAFALPGSSPSVQATEHSCCASGVPGKKTPTQDEKSRCAVCYFAAGLSLPPVITFRFDLQGIATLLPIPSPTEIAYQPFPLPYDALAPPCA